MKYSPWSLHIHIHSGLWYYYRFGTVGFHRLLNMSIFKCWISYSYCYQNIHWSCYFMLIDTFKRICCLFSIPVLTGVLHIWLIYSHTLSFWCSPCSHDIFCHSCPSLYDALSPLARVLSLIPSPLSFFPPRGAKAITEKSVISSLFTFLSSEERRLMKW